MEVIDSAPVTNEMIQEWADRVEYGYNVNVLKKRGRRPTEDGAARVVPVRMGDSLVVAVDQHTEKDGTSRPEIVRSTVQAFAA